MFSLSYWRQEHISSIPPATEHCSVYNWIAVANATCSLLAKIITENQEFNKKTLRNPRRAHTSPQRILSHFSQRLWIAQVSLYFWNKWIHIVNMTSLPIATDPVHRLESKYFIHPKWLSSWKLKKLRKISKSFTRVTGNPFINPAWTSGCWLYFFLGKGKENLDIPIAFWLLEEVLG